MRLQHCMHFLLGTWSRIYALIQTKNINKTNKTNQRKKRKTKEENQNKFFTIFYCHIFHPSHLHFPLHQYMSRIYCLGFIWHLIILSLRKAANKWNECEIVCIYITNPGATKCNQVINPILCHLICHTFVLYVVPSRVSAHTHTRTNNRKYFFQPDVNHKSTDSKPSKMYLRHTHSYDCIVLIDLARIWQQKQYHIWNMFFFVRNNISEEKLSEKQKGRQREKQKKKMMLIKSLNKQYKTNKPTTKKIHIKIMKR